VSQFDGVCQLLSAPPPFQVSVAAGAVLGRMIKPPIAAITAELSSKLVFRPFFVLSNMSLASRVAPKSVGREVLEPLYPGHKLGK
jgi:hypothetical protein